MWCNNYGLLLQNYIIVIIIQIIIQIIMIIIIGLYGESFLQL